MVMVMHMYMHMHMHMHIYVRERKVCRTFWTGSGRDCHAYSEPVRAPEPDQNRHNVKRRCVDQFDFEICP